MNRLPVAPLQTVRLQRVFHVGSWRYDARLEFLNALNNGVEIWHGRSRNANGSTGSPHLGPWSF